LAKEVALLRKQLEDAEREASAAKRELEDVKLKREEARKRLRLKQQQQIQSMKMNSMQRQLGNKQQFLTAPTTASGPRVSTRKSTRSSRRVGGGDVVNHIARVIEEMGRLEEMVKAAEEAQVRAENELFEYATERKKTEEALNSMKQQLERVAGMLSSAADEARGDAQLTEVLKEIQTSLAKCHQDLIGKALAPESSSPSSSSSSSSESPSVQDKLARRRGMSFNVTPLAPAPPQPPSGGLVPPPPPPAGDVSLLSVIREGKPLQPADLQALRQKNTSMRQSVVVVQSLTDTLREALKMRNESMNDDEEEEDEDDEWLG